MLITLAYKIQGSQVHVENIEENGPKANFSVPLCTLKQIGSEVINSLI